MKENIIAYSWVHFHIPDYS